MAPDPVLSFSPMAGLTASRSELMRVQGLGEKVASVIKSFDVDSVAERVLWLADK